MTRPNTSIIATPTPAKTAKLTNRMRRVTQTSPARAGITSGIDTLKNQVIGMDAIIARPPQLVVTSAARKVVLIRRREPDRLFNMYRAGSGIDHASPAAAVQLSPFQKIALAPPKIPIVMP